MTSRLESIPGPVRRFVGFTAGGLLVYAALVTVAAAFFPSALGPDSSYPLAAILMAGIAAYHLVYRGGYERLAERLR